MELTSRKSLPSRLVECLTSDFQELLGTGEPMSVRRVWMSRHPYSCIFRVEFSTQNGPQAVFLKCTDSFEPPVKQIRWAERFQQEFSVLGRLWQQFGDASDTGVVRPLNYYPEFSALATVAAPGVRLRRLLRATPSPTRRSGSEPDDLHQYLVRSGEWLRRFHEMTAGALQPLDSDALLEYCEDRLVALQQSSRSGLQPQIARQVLSSLERIAADSDPVQTAGCHGDFMSHNIMVHQGKIRVLDFTMYEEGPVTYDPCSLWSELEFLKYEVRANRGYLSFLQNAFMEAYGPEVHPDQPLFKAIHVRHLLVALSKLATASPSGFLREWYSRRRASVYQEKIRSFAASGA